MEATPKGAFERFLKDRHAKLFPSILDDELPDRFNDWVTDIGVTNLIDLADEYHDKLVEAVRVAREALAEISKGNGRFSQDHLTHASNTIEDMKELANEALKLSEGLV